MTKAKSLADTVARTQYYKLMGYQQKLIDFYRKYKTNNNENNCNLANKPNEQNCTVVKQNTHLADYQNQWNTNYIVIHQVTRTKCNKMLPNRNKHAIRQQLHRSTRQ